MGLVLVLGLELGMVLGLGLRQEANVQLLVKQNLAVRLRLSLGLMWLNLAELILGLGLGLGFGLGLVGQEEMMEREDQGRSPSTAEMAHWWDHAKPVQRHGGGFGRRRSSGQAHGSQDDCSSRVPWLGAQGGGPVSKMRGQPLL